MTYLTVIDNQTEETILDFFANLRLGMSEVQIRHFVLNDVDYPLPYSKVQQAKLELWAKLESLMQLQVNQAEQQAKLWRAQAQIEELAARKPGTNIARLRYNADILEAQTDENAARFALMVTDKMVEEKKREIDVFLRVIAEQSPLIPKMDELEAETLHWQTVFARQRKVNNVVTAAQAKLELSLATPKITNGG